ncbi:MAG: DUF2275 domain-containing protein [Nitrospirota bacterium]
MDCQDIRDKLTAYLEDDLSGPERSQFEMHLQSCPKCSLELEEMKKTIALAQAIEETEPPAWLTQKVMARVREEAAEKKGILQRLFFPLHIKVPIEVFATIAIAVTAFYVFKSVEPEIKPPESITIPSTDIQETVKEEAVMQAQAPAVAPERRPAAAPEPGKKPGEAEGLAPSAGKAEEAADLAEDKAVLRETSGAADMRMKKELRALAPPVMMKAAEAEKATMLLAVYVKDTLHVQEEIEKKVETLKGKIIRSEVSDNKMFFTVKLDSSKVDEFRKALDLLGDVKEEEALPHTEGEVEIGIKVVKTGVRLH